ncbi:hypothetical protein CQ010_01240 [Arthrobacter sp. MYb211]|uniref:hypothetical protein n=1 Tax=unclassified Arthrobacter TaxID=235627 RepID=UPI000CFB6269|nr:MULTISPECIES: hypothetical protein [unclassified Arthrobacter]PRA13298.1 hypothetical protein CQ015_03495 [Arthrobacter sp. MYb221]PRC10495.1 hypothetical protein CQ010_01240 [Arthrobacter sp. MYb211]
MVNECVLGLDLSLTSTGLSMAYLDGSPMKVGTVTSKGSKDASWAERSERMDKILTDIAAWTDRNWEGNLKAVVMEGPSYGSTVGHQHDRSGLWWMVYNRFSRQHTVFVVQPQTRAKYATGMGNAGKDTVLAATVKQFLSVDITNNDIADAVQLAAMGARKLGWPIDGAKSAKCLEAFDKVST